MVVQGRPYIILSRWCTKIISVSIFARGYKRFPLLAFNDGKCFFRRKKDFPCLFPSPRAFFILPLLWSLPNNSVFITFHFPERIFFLFRCSFCVPFNPSFNEVCQKCLLLAFEWLLSLNFSPRHYSIIKFDKTIDNEEFSRWNINFNSILLLEQIKILFGKAFCSNWCHTI